MNTKSLKGKKFGKWFVVSKLKSRTEGHCLYKAKCACGTIRILREVDLKSGHTKSCGCRRKELATTHGLRYSTEYSSWSCMFQRCYREDHKSFKYYGGRGISVCKKWKKFENFIEDMGMKPTSQHSIDRINADKNYIPSNCRWATKKEQAINKRKK